MPRNFDDELPQDLTFIAAGETFTGRLATAELLAVFEDETDPDTAKEGAARVTGQVRAMLIDGDQERWDKAVAAGEIPYVQLKAIRSFLLGVNTGRPTEPPSPSESGRGGTGRSSRGRSS